MEAVAREVTKAAARGEEDGDGAVARHALCRLLAGNASALPSLPSSLTGARVLVGARVLAFLLDSSLGPPVWPGDDEV